MRIFQAGNVVNDGEAASEITLAENSSAENDEKHGRADGRACIDLGRVPGPGEKARGKLTAESGQRHHREERLEGERKSPAIREKSRFIRR